MRECSLKGAIAALLMVGGLVACSSAPDAPLSVSEQAVKESNYRIGPGDKLQVFVWRNTELSTTVQVRPDGKISVPLIEDLPVIGKTPTETARAIEEKLGTFVKDAVVTVIMVDFVGPTERLVRVVGEATKPAAMPYRRGMTVLDVMVAVGGLTQYASGNRAVIARTVDGKQTTYRVRLDALMKEGDMSANAEVAPGDILMIPQSWF